MGSHGHAPDHADRSITNAKHESVEQNVIVPSQSNDVTIIPGTTRYESPDQESVSSHKSLDPEKDNMTPPESPGNPLSPDASQRMSHLSLRNTDATQRLSASRGRPQHDNTSTGAPKRSPSKELPRLMSPHARASAAESKPLVSRPGRPKRAPTSRRQHAVKTAGRGRPVPKDSGYDSAGRSQTLVKAAQSQLPQAPFATKPIERVLVAPKGLGSQVESQDDITPMMKQPESSPISPDQLATEVKGIYAGLVMVEAKCINIDAAQAAEPKSPLTKDQWQALIALHRTLLYEHHDFLMATQHPTATPMLRGLALKYSMPARMWKHGIHAFLEVLRHRRPASQEYMLAFIYLAYQMMALLFETVPSFTDTWIECLGDLARYRMAIEEEKEAHATWGGVAARWYTMASDRSPQVGRLYHHLGILERPSLRKLCYYVKSLTCTIPFTNARDSLATLCSPIVQDDKSIESSNQSVEARIVTFHALVCSGKGQDIIEKVGRDSLRLLTEQNGRLRDIGTNHGITSIASLFERGYALNPLWRLYNDVYNQNQNLRSAQIKPDLTKDLLSTNTFQAQISESLSFSADFCYKSFNMVLHKWNDQSPMVDHLPYVHVMLAWQHSLHNLRRRKGDADLLADTFRTLTNPSRVSWTGLAAFLNSLSRYHPISAFVLAHGREGTFPRLESARPLSEDYSIRGLIWAQNYFESDHFAGQAEDDGRAIETEAMRRNRGDRVQWLGLYIAFHAGYLHYDESTRLFSVPGAGEELSESVLSAATTFADDLRASETANSVVGGTVTPQSVSCKRSSSSRSNSDDGFCVVKHPRTQQSSQPTGRPTPRVPTDVASGRTMRKAMEDSNQVKVMGEDDVMIKHESKVP